MLSDVTCDGRPLFPKLMTETGKAHLQTVERLNGGSASCDCSSDFAAGYKCSHSTQLNSTNLLNVSISGLPHVVIFYDALQRLPRQLHQKKNYC